MADLSDKQLLAYLETLEAELRPLVEKATAGLPSGSPRAIRRRILRGREDRFWFYRHYLPHLFTEPFAAWQREMGEFIDAHAQAQFLVWRGSGKSTVLDRAEALRALTAQDTSYAILTSRTDKQTYPMVLRLRVEFEANARIRQDYGDQALGPLWSMHHFILKNGREVQGLSLKGAARGMLSIGNKRPELWILNDLQELRDARSPEVIEGTLDFILSVVIPAMNKRRGKVWVAGTKISEDCAMARLEHDPHFPTFKRAAEDGTMTHFTDPLRFPRAVLEAEKRLIGSERYNREYLHVAVGREGRFRHEWVRTYRAEQLAGLPLIAAVYWDPAIAPRGDFKAIVTWALHAETGHRYCLRAFLSRGASPREQAFEYFRQIRTLNARPDTVWVSGYEANGFQALLEYPLEECRRALGLPADVLGTQVVNTVNKEIRVAAMAPAWEGGSVFFCQGDSDQDLLVDQHVFWPKRGMDGPDATRGAWQLIDGLAFRDPALAVPGIGAAYPEQW